MAGLEPILPTREIVGLEGKKKQFQKWHGIRIKMGACRSWSSRHFGISIALMCGSPMESSSTFSYMLPEKGKEVQGGTPPLASLCGGAAVTWGWVPQCTLNLG